MLSAILVLWASRALCREGVGAMDGNGHSTRGYGVYKPVSARKFSNPYPHSRPATGAKLYPHPSPAGVVYLRVHPHTRHDHASNTNISNSNGAKPSIIQINILIDRTYKNMFMATSPWKCLLLVYGVQMLVVVAGLWVERAYVYDFQTRKILPLKFKYKPHLYPWA